MTPPSEPGTPSTPAPTEKVGAAKEYRQLQEFIRRVRKCAARQPGLNVYWLTFTYQWWARPEWCTTQAIDLAAAIAKAKGEGIWIIADVGDDGRFHWHAIAISARDPRWFVTYWQKNTGASKKAQKVRYVEGQTERESSKFEVNLGRAIMYGCKRAAGLPTALRDRAVASGSMRRCWRKSFGSRQLASAFTPPDSMLGKPSVNSGKKRERSADAAEPRPCQRPGCPKFIEPGKPPQTRFHSAACKAAWHRANRNGSRNDTPPPDPPVPGGDD